MVKFNTVAFAKWDIQLVVYKAFYNGLRSALCVNVSQNLYIPNRSSGLLRNKVNNAANAANVKCDDELAKFGSFVPMPHKHHTDIL